MDYKNLKEERRLFENNKVYDNLESDDKLILSIRDIVSPYKLTSQIAEKDVDELATKLIKIYLLIEAHYYNLGKLMEGNLDE